MSASSQTRLMSLPWQALSPGSPGTWIILTLVAVLVATWTLPHVIALRKILLLTLLVWLLLAQRHDRQWRFSTSNLWLPSLCLAALTIWLFVVAFWVDSDPLRSLDGVKGEWLPAIVAFGIGGLLLPTLSHRGVKPRYPLRVIFASLMMLAILQLLFAIWLVLFRGGLPDFFGGISDHKQTITHVTIIALGMLLADIMAQKPTSGLLGLSRWMQWVALLILLATTYVSGARNGILVFLLVVAIWAPFYVSGVLRLSARTKLIATLGLALCLVFAFWAMIKVDDRWTRLVATVPVAWDVESDYAWLDILERGLPLAEDGRPVEATAYERIAWARVGQKLIKDYPLGVGVSKDVFKELVEKEYGPTRAAHAHNGYLDFALAVGLPGLLLWLVFLALLLKAGFDSLRLGDMSSVALILLVVAFGFRSGLDTTMRDHILEEFLFFVGLFLAALNVETKPDEG